MALREIGSAFVRLFVKKDGLSADLKSAETEVKQAAQNMEASGKQASVGIFEGIKGVNKAFTATIGATLKLISNITLIGTAIGLVVGLALKMAGAFGDAEDKAKQLRIEIEKTGKEMAGGEKEPLSGLIRAVGVADEEVQKLQQRLSEKNNTFRDTGFGGESVQELQSKLGYAIRTRERAIDTLRNYQTKAADEVAKKDEEIAKKKAAEQEKAADLARETTVEHVNEYDADSDPLLKGIEQFRKTHEEAIKFIFDFYNKSRVEATRKWSESVRAAQAEAHAERLAQIEREAQAYADVFRQYRSFMDSQRNQSASGDMRTLIALVKELVDR